MFELVMTTVAERGGTICSRTRRRRSWRFRRSAASGGGDHLARRWYGRFPLPPNPHSLRCSHTVMAEQVGLWSITDLRPKPAWWPRLMEIRLIVFLAVTAGGLR